MGYLGYKKVKSLSIYTNETKPNLTTNEYLNLKTTAMKNIEAELIKRQSTILSEPNGIVRETMIENLLIDIFTKQSEKYTQRQNEIIDRLDFLVGRRYTIEDLNKYLSLHFYEEIEVSDVTKDKDECDLSDHNFMFSSLENDTYGYFDIYFLPTREPNIFLITEIGFEFENLN